MADIQERTDILTKLFNAYELFAGEYDNACSDGCAVCCTRNVTLTGLEGRNIMSGIPGEKKSRIFDRIHQDIKKKRLIPQTTINQMAKLCMEGKEVPDDHSDPDWGSCPLLEENRCTIYEFRPFACRCMVSRVKCEASGFADMDDFLITLNNVFMQYIEHIDIGGSYGNLSDILLSEAGQGHENLITNIGVELLMVPPEHQARIKEVITALQRI